MILSLKFCYRTYILVHLSRHSLAYYQFSTLNNSQKDHPDNVLSPVLITLIQSVRCLVPPASQQYFPLTQLQHQSPATGQPTIFFSHTTPAPAQWTELSPNYHIGPCMDIVSTLAYVQLLFGWWMIVFAYDLHFDHLNEIMIENNYLTGDKLLNLLKNERGRRNTSRY